MNDSCRTENETDCNIFIELLSQVLIKGIVYNEKQIFLFLEEFLPYILNLTKGLFMHDLTTM